MNVKIGAEAALFPEKEYIKGIFVAVYPPNHEESNETRTLFRPVVATCVLHHRLNMELEFQSLFGLHVHIYVLIGCGRKVIGSIQ
jgi:hypothetical protein